MGGPHTTCEGWVEDGKTTLHVRGGEGMGGVAGAVHVIPSWCLFLMHFIWLEARDRIHGTGSYSAGIQHRSMLSSQESGARVKGIIVVTYHIHFPFLQESHIWDEYCGQKWDFFPIVECIFPLNLLLFIT